MKIRKNAHLFATWEIREIVIFDGSKGGLQPGWSFRSNCVYGSTAICYSTYIYMQTGGLVHDPNYPQNYYTAAPNASIYNVNGVSTQGLTLHMSYNCQHMRYTNNLPNSITLWPALECYIYKIWLAP